MKKREISYQDKMITESILILLFFIILGLIVGAIVTIIHNQKQKK